MTIYEQKIEEEILSGQHNRGGFGSRVINFLGKIFDADRQAGNNTEELAQVLATYDFAMKALGWENEPIADLSKIISEYQASLSAKYHNDYKDVLIAEEIERRREERKGISILQQ